MNEATEIKPCMYDPFVTGWSKEPVSVMWYYNPYHECTNNSAPRVIHRWSDLMPSVEGGVKEFIQGECPTDPAEALQIKKIVTKNEKPAFKVGSYQSLIVFHPRKLVSPGVWCSDGSIIEEPKIEESRALIVDKAYCVGVDHSQSRYHAETFTYTFFYELHYSSQMGLSKAIDYLNIKGHCMEPRKEKDTDYATNEETREGSRHYSFIAEWRADKGAYEKI